MANYIGQDIGIYHVESLCEYKTNDGHKLYHVKCRYCEFESDMKISDAKRPKTCLHKTKFGRIIDFKMMWSNQRLRNVFNDMMQRCYNQHHKDYRWYGANGIGICQQWLYDPKSFEEWALNNGYADNLTIDRIESNKGYCPDNCRWIVLAENSRRAGNVNWITVNNCTLTGKQWAKRLNLSCNTINKYISKYGVDSVKRLICKMQEEPISTKNRKKNQTWFDVYGIHV